MMLCLGCNKLTKRSRCADCQKLVDRAREARRGPREHYSGDWARISRELRAQYPYCQNCGATETRLEVHHVKARSMEQGLLVLCVPCHNKIGREEQK